MVLKSIPCWSMCMQVPARMRAPIVSNIHSAHIWQQISHTSTPKSMDEVLAFAAMNYYTKSIGVWERLRSKIKSKRQRKFSSIFQSFPAPKSWQVNAIFSHSHFHRKLSKLFPFIDASRVAIWGWSYGGYASGMALAKDNSHVFKCAASVAPVTDWTFYGERTISPQTLELHWLLFSFFASLADTIYTERFMGLPIPEDNMIGYDRSRLSTLQDSFRNKTYLLVHGSLDDNVHYQQSMALARTLELSDIPFDQIVSLFDNFSFHSAAEKWTKNTFFRHRHIQMRIIHCGESGSICTMLSINTLPNVLRKSEPATGNLCNICIYEIEPQKSTRPEKQQLTSIYYNRIILDFHLISSSVISLLHFAAIAIIFIRYHRPKQKWKKMCT